MFIRITQRILQRDQSLVNIPKEDGFTALHLAVFNNRPEVLRLLLAQVNMIKTQTHHSLHLAFNLHPACLELDWDLVSCLHLKLDLNRCSVLG